MATQAQGKLHTFYERLKHPSIISDHTHGDLREQVISTLFLLQTGLTILILVFYTPIHSDPIAMSAIFGFGVLSGVCLMMSRTRYYNWSIYLYIALMLTSLFGLFVANHNNPSSVPEYSLSYLTTVIFFTSLLLSLRATIFVSVLSLIGITLTPLMVDVLHYPVHLLWLFTLVTSVLIIITAMVRHDVFRRLQDSEKQARSLMEAYMDAVLICSNNRKILAVNPAFTKLLGYQANMVIGKTIGSLAKNENSHHVFGIHLMLTIKSEPTEVELLHQNGNTIVVELISQPYEYQNQSAHVFIVRDMRQYKATLRKQHEQEIRYQSLLDLTNDAVFITNFEGEYVAVNEHAGELLGLPTQELVGKSYRDFVPKVYHTASDRVIERLMAGEQLPLYERQFIRSNGHRFPAEVMVRLLHDGNDEPQYIHSIVRDISERKKSEDQRIELALERDRMSHLQQFLRDAAHYFRTPLTSLKTSQYLLTQIHDNPAKQAHFLNVIKLEVARLERLLGDMMLSTQLDKEYGDGITFGRLELSEIIREIVDTFSPAEKRDNYAEIIIEPEIPSNLMYIMASRPKLTTAIHRLLDNAVTYSPDDSQVIVTAYQHEQNIYIKVKDSGMGITADEMPQIFQRFRRADRAVEKAHVGNGLGLFIAQKIVEMHYGEIIVESVPDEGSTFISQDSDGIPSKSCAYNSSQTMI